MAHHASSYYFDLVRPSFCVAFRRLPYFDARAIVGFYQSAKPLLAAERPYHPFALIQIHIPSFEKVSGNWFVSHYILFDYLGKPELKTEQHKEKQKK